MTYVLLSGGFLAAAILSGLLLARTDCSKRLSWPAVGIAGAGLLILTAIFDTIMIWFDLFSYDQDLISGVHIGLVPIEDFAYPLATVIALPALWVVLTNPDSVRMNDLLRHAWMASRPVSWINTAFPFAAAYLLTTREVDWLLEVGTIYYLVPYNLAMYGINDVFDYASDIRNPRKGSIEGGLLPPAFHRPLLWLVAATNLPFLVVLFAAGNTRSALAIAVSTFAVIAYSAARLRFKERPLLDSLTSSVHFVSPAVVGLALAGSSFGFPVIVMLAAFLAWGMAAHAFGAVQDIGPDRQAGIGSIATVFGARWTVRFAIALWSVAGVLLMLVPWPGNLAAVIVLPYIINCAPFANVSDDAAATTNPAWRRFIWLNYLAGFVVTQIMIVFWRMG